MSGVSVRVCVVEEHVMHIIDHAETIGEGGATDVALSGKKILRSIKTESNIPQIIPDPTDSRVAVMDKNEITVVDLLTLQDVCKVPIVIHPAAIGFFSPSGRYLSVATNTRFEERNIVVIDTTTGDRVLELTNKIPDHLWPLFHYNADETAIFFITPTGIHPIRPGATRWTMRSMIKAESLGRISGVSTCPAGDAMAVFTIDRKGGGPSRVTVVDMMKLTHASTVQEARVFNKSVHHVNEMHVSWAGDSSSAAIRLESLVDRENKSYYGKSALIALRLERSGGRLTNVATPIPEGNQIDLQNIATAQCSPAAPTAVVIGGVMPAAIMSFATEGRNWTPRGTFGVHPRNGLEWAPSGDFLALTGFAGLSGYLDIWDTTHKAGKSCRLVGSTVVPNTTHCKWLSDSRFIMTSTQTPRLRVDNSYKLILVDGSVLADESFEALFGLHAVVVSDGAVVRGRGLPGIQLRKASRKANVDQAQSAVAAYVPPQMRGKTTAAAPKAPELVYTRLDVDQPKARAPADDVPPGFAGFVPAPKKAAPKKPQSSEEIATGIQKRLRAIRKKLRECERVPADTTDPVRLGKLSRVPGFKKDEKELVDALAALGITA